MSRLENEQKRAARQRKSTSGYPSEKVIENSILTFLKANRVFCWKNESVGVFDVKRGIFRKKHGHRMVGGSDILGIYKNKFLAIEVKAPKKYATKEQKAFLDSVNIQGGIGFVARSIADVILFLQMEGK